MDIILHHFALLRLQLLLLLLLALQHRSALRILVLPFHFFLALLRTTHLQFHTALPLPIRFIPDPLQLQDLKPSLVYLPLFLQNLFLCLLLLLLQFIKRLLPCLGFLLLPSLARIS